MHLSDADRRAYPRLYQYLRYSMPHVADVGVIVRNMQTYGHLNQREFADALTWGEPPLVKVVDLSGGSCAGVPAYGCTRNSTEIELDRATVLDFERDPNGRGSGRTASGRKVYIVGVTFLHELCHWGHNVKGLAETGHSGLIFERKTYGQVIG